MNLPVTPRSLTRTVVAAGNTLAALLETRGLMPSAIVAVRNTLHPSDMCSDFRTLDDVMRANALHLLDRMQDGPCIAHGRLVLSFAAMEDGRARLTSFRRFLMRRPGIVPGDIVYDYDAAHLLHSFIARTDDPVFYDAFDEEGFEDLLGHLVVQWPQPLSDNIREADDPALVVVGLSA